MLGSIFKKNHINGYLLGVLLGLFGCSSDDFNIPDVPTDPVTVMTNPITEISQKRATIEGTLMGGSDDTVYAKGIVWNEFQNPTLSNHYTNEGPGYGNFESTLSDLEVNTPYYVKAYVTTDNGTTYGNEILFNTLDHHTFEGDLSLTSQTAIEAFQTEGYTQVTGALLIEEASPGAITSLQPLEALLDVGSQLNTTDIALEIRNNTALNSLSGLQRVDTITGGIRIAANTSLNTLEGFPELPEITGSLVLEDLPQLTNLVPLAGVTAIGEDLDIRSTAINNLLGMQLLQSVGGRLILRANNSMSNLLGLEPLEVIGMEFDCRDNAILATTDGLSGLLTVGQVLRFFDNPQLADYCDLTPIAIQSGDPDLIETLGNSYNPTTQDIINGDCSI